jgi:hypothetical protein
MAHTDAVVDALAAKKNKILESQRHSVFLRKVTVASAFENLYLAATLTLGASLEVS